MALDLTSFETIIPSRFLSFTVPNPTRPTHLLRVASLDSPGQIEVSPRVAALFVPQNRESDWVFSTESGHFQLLFCSWGISRLILVGDDPNDGHDSAALNRYDKDKDAQCVKSLEKTLRPLLIALSPKVCVEDSNFEVPILEYDDDIVSSVVLERCFGAIVGEMLVEDVEKKFDRDDCDYNGGKTEFRRRLRFKRMPNLVQSEIRIEPEKGSSLFFSNIGDGVGFRPVREVLVQSYLSLMVASLHLIGPPIENSILKGIRPGALCLGVGGGALLSFLSTQLGFEVFGVENDEEVLRIARKYFGLEDEAIRVCIGDAVDVLKKLASEGRMTDCFLDGRDDFDPKFDVIMVDLDSSDARNGSSAPPSEFARREVLLAAKSVLCDYGILVVNVITPSRSSYNTLISKFQDIFAELHEIEVEDGDHFVLIASASAVLSAVGDGKNSFVKKLRSVIPGKFLDSIKKISGLQV